MTLLQNLSLSCDTSRFDMFLGMENTCCIYMLHQPYFISNQLWNTHIWVCCILMFQAKQCINDMNDAHAYEMQVQMWKPNTWGVTQKVCTSCRHPRKAPTLSRRSPDQGLIDYATWMKLMSQTPGTLIFLGVSILGAFHTKICTFHIQVFNKVLCSDVSSCCFPLIFSLSDLSPCITS
jgi:hypothetical protein